MNAADYKSERERRGTQEEVAALLGVARSTVARRETGALPITHEAALALLALPKRKASLEAISVTVTSGKKVPVVSIRFRGERPTFMPEAFKALLSDAGYSSSIHLSSGPATDCADDEFDVLTSPQMSGTPRMIAPAEINAVIQK